MTLESLQLIQFLYMRVRRREHGCLLQVGGHLNSCKEGSGNALQAAALPLHCFL